jgi:hypothetical protein
LQGLQSLFGKTRSLTDGASIALKGIVGNIIKNIQKVYLVNTFGFCQYCFSLKMHFNRDWKTFYFLGPESDRIVVSFMAGNWHYIKTSVLGLIGRIIPFR